MDSNANVIKSRFLHSAIMFGKYELAASLIKAGYIIERSLLPQDVGYQLSRKIVHMSAEHAVTCFSQYASWSDEEKVKLDDSCIYTSGSPFEDSEVFRVVCAGFDISRFSKKKLFDFAVRLADSKNVELLVDRGIVHLNKPLLARYGESQRLDLQFFGTTLILPELPLQTNWLAYRTGLWPARQEHLLYRNSQPTRQWIP